MTIDLFELNEPKDLFFEIQSAIVEYHEHPTSRLFLFLVFSLNHLREWIAEKSYEQIEARMASNAVLTGEEKLFYEIWKLEEFRMINSLCNRSKHYRVSTSPKTSVTQGFTVDSPVGDSLGQVYYRIDGKDSRIVFAAVIREYNAWFSGNV